MAVGKKQRYLFVGLGLLGVCVKGRLGLGMRLMGRLGLWVEGRLGL